MLQSIRDHLTGWVAVVLFTIIALAFAVWGIDYQLFTGGTAVAQVNGEEIPEDEIRRVYRNQLSQYQQVYPEVPAELDEQIKLQSLQGLVRDELLAQHTSDEGYRVGNSNLVTAIRNMQMFQDQGQFSPDLYRIRLTQQGLSPQYFEAQMRRSLRIVQLQQGITQTAFLTPWEIEQKTRLEREQRRVEWAKLDVAALQQSIDISDEQIKAHYDANPDRYMRSETVDIEYIELNMDELAAASDVTEEGVNEYYEQEVAAGRFQAPPERQASHILIAVDDETDESQARELAGQLLERVSGGEDFAALATEYSDDPGSAPQGGDLGWAQETAYVGAFADALFSMETGAVTGPVRTEFGYHVIRLEDQRGGEPKAFDEVREELEAELKRNQTEDEFYDLADQLADLSFENPDALAPIADQLGVQIKTRKGLARDVQQSVAAPPLMIEAAFSERVLDQRENSDILEPTSEQRIVLRVTEYQPAKLRPLNEVTDAIAAELRRNAAQELAAETGQAMLVQVRAGQALESLAPEQGASYTAIENYRRTSGIAPELRNAVFSAVKPEPGKATVDGVALADGSYAVFVLTEVVPGDTRTAPAQDNAKSQSGVADLAAYIAQLRREAKVVLRPELLQ